jgi:hypothetical protein
MGRRKKIVPGAVAASEKVAPGTPTDGESVADFVRREVQRAFGIVAERGRPLAALLANELENKPLSTLGAISKYIPKEIENRNVTRTPLQDLSDADLRELVDYVKRAGVGEPGQSVRGDTPGGSTPPGVSETDTVH